ncbi:MAG: phosphoribosylglycinamide synthetase C domain-containing protein, partial [Oscillospiraceae bacterium]
EIDWSNNHAACVIMASGGYPEKYEKGIVIEGLDEKGQPTDKFVTVYHAGTKITDGKLVTNGGRVLGVSATATTQKQALEKAYQAVETIHFAGAHYRHDIGIK